MKNLKEVLEGEIFPAIGSSAFDVADSIACVLNEYQGNKFDEGAKSVYNAIANFYERIFKDTNRQINILRDFYEKLADITSVNIIGHSMSDVDFPYFQLVELYSQDVKVWNAYYYDIKEKNDMKKNLL